jgi:hypothetical protein
MGRSVGGIHANRVLDVLAGGRIANSGLAASWRRSGHLHALDPANRAPSRRLTQREVAAAQERLGRLFSAAQSTLDRLFLAVGEVGCSVLLADGGGLVVDRRGAVADDASLMPGVFGQVRSGARSSKEQTESAPASSKKGQLSSTVISTSSLAIRACSVQPPRFSTSMAHWRPRSTFPRAAQT